MLKELLADIKRYKFEKSDLPIILLHALLLVWIGLFTAIDIATGDRIGLVIDILLFVFISMGAVFSLITRQLGREVEEIREKLWDDMMDTTKKAVKLAEDKHAETIELKATIQKMREKKRVQ